MPTLFLCGDVMLGRGIDQVLAHPSPPALHEPYIRDARDYVALAREAHGPIPARVPDDYVWGDALQELRERRPDARIANLETAVTASDAPWPGKGIHYRLHPANIGCLAAVRPDCCALANNHVMDWGVAGLLETLDALRAAGIRTAGAGRDLDEARAPACIPVPGGRVLVFAWAMPSSGVSAEWAAGAARPGVNLASPSPSALASAARHIAGLRRAGDVVVASVHWGPNWGYDVAGPERRFAQGLVEAGADVVHGHSSHHPKGIEIHRGRAILHGCGDFINDYEGITGWEAYRPELALMYFAALDARGALERLDVVAMRMNRFRLEHAPAPARRWIDAMLRRESARLGVDDGRYRRWVSVARGYHESAIDR